MATLVRIKRSETSGNPAVLAAGELAYSGLTDNGSNGGDRLYIGFGAETAGDAANHFVIGGKYFTDMLDHTRGTLTASSALLVDADKKLDEIYISNTGVGAGTTGLKIVGSTRTISSEGTDEDILISPNGTGKVNITKTLDIDGDLIVDGGDINVSSAATAIAVKDNTANALTIKEDGNIYISVTTTDNDEHIDLYKQTIISLENSTANAVSYPLDIRHTTSGLPVNGIGSGLRFLTETSADNVEAGITLESVAVDTTLGSEDFDLVVRGMITGTAAAQILRLNGSELQVGAQNVNSTITTYGTADLTLSTNAGTNSGTIIIRDGANNDIEITPNGNGNVVLSTDTVQVGDENANATITTHGTGDLVLNTNSGVNSGAITIFDGVDGHVKIEPNGAGHVQLVADTAQIGDANATAYLTTNGTGNLVLSTNNGTNSGSITINQGTDGNIDLAPNGTGDVTLQSDTVRIGDQAANATLTTWGAGDLILNTNDGTDSSTIRIYDAANGNIELTPNGTGSVVLDKVKITDNIISTVDTDSNLIIDPNGTGKISFYNAYTFPDADGTGGYVLTTNGSGVVSWQASAASLTVAADSGTADSVSLLTDTLTFEGTNPVQTVVSNNKITISVDDATTSAKGIASFDTNNFTVTTGAVSTKNITLGTSTLTNGSTTTSLAGIQQLDVDNIQIDGNTISSTNLDGNITLSPNGAGVVDVSSSRITNVSEPQNDSDAATKFYVDSVAQGLHVHAPCAAATTDTLATLSSGTVTYDNGVDGVGARLITTGTYTLIDTVNIASVGKRILVKNETNAAHNGIYVYTSATELTRAADYNTPVEMAGGDFTFVQNGFQYNDTGWVMTDPVTTVGSSAVNFLQFSGAGAYSAGNGLALDGTVFSLATSSAGSGLAYTTGVLSVNTANGLEVVSDNVQLASSAAGAGLAYTTGVLSVNTANGLEVVSDNVQIASSAAGAGLAYASGVLSVNTANGLEVVSDNVQIASSVAGSGLTYTTGVLSVNTANGLEVSGDNVQLANSVAGAGLTYTNGILAIGGTADRITINADSIDIASTYIGQSTITTLGTITTGTWHGTTIAEGYGGTNQTTYATGDFLYASAANTLAKRSIGTAGQLLQVALVGSDLVPVWAHVDGGSY